MVFVILGMHKSGTTLVAKTLHASGIPMGTFDESLGYDQGNKYEMREIIDINNQLLQSNQQRSIDIKKQLHITDTSVRNFKDLLAKINSKYKKNWGFKDPRTVFTYQPFWKEHLPQHKTIFVYRHYLSVVEHYKGKNPLLWFKALKSWCAHNSTLIEVFHSLKAQEKMIISYETLMNNESAIDKISKFTGIKCIDVRDKKMFRNKGRLNLKTLAVGIYIIFSNLTPKKILKELNRLENEEN